MANKNKKNKNKKSSKAKTQAEEPQPLPTSKVLPSVLQATANGIGPNGILTLGGVAQEKIAETSYMKPGVVCRPVTDINNTPFPTYCVVSIPPKSVDRPVDPDGHAECIISSDDKKRLFDCPLFLTERVPQARPNTITIKECATGGLGMFATRDITYGELLFAERPLLMNPSLHESYFLAVDGYTLEDLLKLTSIEEEQLLEQALKRMDDDKKDAYMALANSIQEDGPLSSIQQTNAFGLDLNELTRDGGVAPDPDELSRAFAAGVGLEPNMYSVTAKNASRMNHSCCPNTDFNFSLGSFSLQFHALRDIKAGEEIFVSYTDVDVPAAERRERLAPYGFTCVCTACSRATPESDKFRQAAASEMKVLNARYRIAKEYDQKRNNGMRLVREIILPKVLEFRRKLTEEGLGIMFGVYLNSTIMLHEVHVQLGMFEEPEAKAVFKDLMAWTTMQAQIQGHPLSKNGKVTLKVPKL